MAQEEGGGLMDLGSIWSAKESSGSLPPGIYHAEVAHAEARHSQNGNLMWNLRLKLAGSDRTLCFDRLMMGGSDAALGMTKARLKALGVAEGANIEVEDLIGRRAYVATVLGDEREDKEGNMRRYLEVDISARGSKVGYWPEANPPAGVVATPPGPGGVPNNLDTPFI